MNKLYKKCFRNSLNTFSLIVIILYIISDKCIDCLSFRESVAAAYTATHSDQIELKFSIPEGVPIGTLIGVIKSSNSSLITQPPYLIVPVPGGAHKSNSSKSSVHSANSGVETDLNIDQTTGELRTAVQLDREQRSYYEFIAIPLTGANIKVTITIEDINDNPPHFLNKDIDLEFPENSKPRDVKRTLPPAKDLDLGLFGTQKYRIVSGNIGNAFRLLSHREKDDVLYLDLQVNGPLDRETISNYSLVIEALDGGQPPLKDEMTVRIAILDHNDCEPVFNQSHYYASVAENVTIGTSLLRVSATDNDQGENGQVTYTIHSQNTGLSSLPTHFGIEKKTGWIFVTRPLDFESKEIHELVVIARDSGAQPLETSAFISIQVTDVNDNQPTISLLYLTENARPEIRENAKVGDLVARVSVNDADLSDSKANLESGHAPSVSLTGSDGRFGLSSQNNGVYLIVVTGPLDREKKSRYSLTVIVTDQGSPPLNTTSIFEIEITDINDNPPHFESNIYHATVPEAADIGTSVFRAKAVDLDSDSHITYSFLEKEHQNSSSSKWFSIDAKSGLITTQSHVDCETDPTPRLIILATDTTPSTYSSNKYSMSFSATTTLVVSISDINDNEPVFDQSFYNITVREDEPIGNCILKISASDADCGVNAMVNYSTMNSMSVMSSNINAFQQDFTIHPITGQLCIAKQLDYETRNSYDIPVLATDRGGLSTTAMIKVLVVDTNDNYPVFYPREYKVSVRQNTISMEKEKYASDPNGATPLVIVAATDRDSNGHPFGTITYSIKDGNEDKAFVIEEQSGKIFIAKSLEPNRTYHLTISARDGGNRESKVPALVQVSVLSDNDPDSSPVFSQRQFSFKVYENVKPETVVGTVSAKTESNESTNISYVIYSGDPEGYFNIDPAHGVIRVRSNNIDHEKHSYLLLNVQAISGKPGGPYRYGHTQVNVTIVDRNDNLPLFGTDNLKISVLENTFAHNVTVLVANAVDHDSGQFGKITYSLSNADNSSSITLPFSIDPNTGAVTLNTELDFERISHYKLKITATDGANLSSHLFVEVLVQDSNDNQPVFTAIATEDRVQYKVSVFESNPIHSPFFQVKAIDADTGNNARLTYSLLSESEIPFGIFPNDGILYVREPLDRESNDKYEVTVKVTDHGSPSPLTSTAVIAITVKDVNDNRPVWSENSYVFTVAENRAVGALVGQISATDQDLGNNASLRYSFSEGQANGNLFQLNPITGEVFIKTTISGEIKDIYEFNVEVRDQGTPQPLFSNAKALVSINVHSIVSKGPELGEVIRSGDSQSPPPTSSMSVPGWVLFLIVLLMLITVVLSISIVVIRLNQHQQQQHLMGDHVRHIGPHNIGSLLRKIGPLGGGDPNLSTYHSHHNSHYGSTIPAPPCYNDVTLSSSAVMVGGEGYSASSGRGSAEDDAEVEADMDDVDEEIRMINENNNFYGEDGDSDVTTTAEYLARLGVVNHHEDERGESSTALEDEEDDLDQLGAISTPRISSIRGQNRARPPSKTEDWPQMCGSLASIVHSEEELSGSYNWDYLQHWGPKYQPLASVFAEIARLKATNGEQDLNEIEAMAVENGSTRSSSTASSSQRSQRSGHRHHIPTHISARIAHPTPSMASQINGFQSLSPINSSPNMENLDLNNSLNVDEEIRI